MFPNRNPLNPIPQVFLTILVASSLLASQKQSASAQEDLSSFKPSFKILVNSDRDEINPDQELTLREAINLVNRTLTWQELSAPEQKQVTTIPNKDASRIEFDFAAPVKIELESTLPPLINPGLVIDGTSHSDYDPSKIATTEIAIPVPVVSLTAKSGKQVFRGLTIAGDRITVKGLSIYGFSQLNFPTDTTPGGDIVVSSRLPNLANQSNNEAQGDLTPKPPLNVKIIDNWLGLPPDESLPETPSSFGVWLFDGENTVIQRNRIYHHGGSGILTSVDAQGMEIRENIIVGNGLTGMPHAIYLEGLLDRGAITDNLLCGNDGSGIYLFKSEGSIQINHNQIKFNGRRVPSAAIYLMGNDHQVTDNQISWQTGTGVTIAAYPQSDRNLLENNQFTNLEGLSIDLNTRDHTNRPFFNLGDGANPPRDSGNRKRDTANRGINAPQFLSEDFYIINGKVNIDGVAEPGDKVTLYQIESAVPRPVAEQSPLASQSKHYGPLSYPLESAIADDQGKFSFTLPHPLPGTILSAIASNPDYGTSEPALNAVIKSFDQPLKSATPNSTIPRCTTKPVVTPPPQLPITPEVAPPKPVIPKVLRNIHFALDQADISPASGVVLDQIATVLKQHPFLTIELQGHTDYRASEEYNLALSKLRAIATRDYLLHQGVQPERMIIRPLGESQLKKAGNTIVEHAYNRRVEVIFRDLRGLEIIFEEQDRDLQLE
jgi:outer membrane protein OmpA-like peptidoglycan-associated protein